MNDQQNADSELDDMLPKDLRPTTRLLSKADQREVTGASVGDTDDPSDHSTEVHEMNTAPMQAAVATLITPPLSNEQLVQIRTLASEEAAKIVAAKDSQTQITQTIERHVVEATQAKAAADKAAADVGAQKAVAADLQSKLDAANAELAEAKKKVAEKDAELTDYTAKFKKAKADLDEASAKLAKAAVDSAIVTRSAALATAGLTESAFAKRAVATKEDGSLKMDDDAFNETLADLKALKPAETEQATAAAAAAATTAAAATPAVPDLSAAAGYQAATAALVAGGAAPVSQPNKVSQYAKAIC